MSEAQQVTGTVDTNAAGAPNAQTPADAGGASNVSPSADTQNTVVDTKTDPAKPGEAVDIVYDFKTPENVPIDQAGLEDFKTIAKDLKLPNEQAQKLVDLAVKREQERAEAFASTVASWAEQTQNDKELGKPENLAVALKAVETFGSPELKTILNSSGLGNHPEVVRAFYKIGKAISEDSITGKSGAPGAGSRDPAQVLYGSPSN